MIGYQDMSSETENIAMEKLISTGNVTGSASTGGIVGLMANGYIKDSHSESLINGVSKTGGFVGEIASGDVQTSYSTATVNGEDCVGGFVGTIGDGGTFYCYSTGNVNGTSFAGGFVGQISASMGGVTKSISKGNVFRTSGTSSLFGMFAGSYESGVIQTSYSTGKVYYDNVLQTSANFCNGSAPYNGFFNINCYFETDNPENYPTDDTHYLPKTHLEMTTVTPYLLRFEWGWDNMNWYCSGGDYPQIMAFHTETLPVELSSLTAVCTSVQTVGIGWTTQSECNVLGYHVFRSQTSELSCSERVTDQMIAAGNTSTQHDYLFTDQTVSSGNEYFYWLMSTDLDGTSSYHGPVNVLVKDHHDTEPIIPITTGLNSAYPNPFNPTTTISFDLQEGGNVSLNIMNIKGQRVRRLAFDNYKAGTHSVVWDGKDDQQKSVSSGVYFCRMISGKNSAMLKLTLMK